MYCNIKCLNTFTLSLVAGLGGLAATASAQERVGVTAIARNIVSQIEPRVARIVVGEEVVRDEVVRTAAEGDARAGDIAIKLTTGAFRLVTGDSKKEAYVVSTSLATIGVRGTTLDFLVERRRNVVVLRAGQANVCVPGKCIDLIHTGDSSVI